MRSIFRLHLPARRDRGYRLRKNEDAMQSTARIRCSDRPDEDEDEELAHLRERKWDRRPCGRVGIIKLSCPTCRCRVRVYSPLDFGDRVVL